MAKLFTSWRLPVLAVLASIALTSCFDKKCDPKPKNWCGTTTTKTTSNGTN